VRSWPPSCFGWVDDYRELTVLPAGVAAVELKRWILFMAPQQTSASDRSRTRLAACFRSPPVSAGSRRSDRLPGKWNPATSPHTGHGGIVDNDWIPGPKTFEIAEGASSADATNHSISLKGALVG
jgi:hypothetical protein